MADLRAGTIELYEGPLDGQIVPRTAEDFVAVAYGSDSVHIGVAVYRVVVPNPRLSFRAYGIFVRDEPPA